jgi:hypothetical protein
LNEGRESGDRQKSLADQITEYQRERPPEPIPATFVLSGSPQWTIFATSSLHTSRREAGLLN